MKATSNSLAVLAANIREGHEEIRRTAQRSAEQAVQIGAWLAEAKADESIPRGGWERWVETVAGVPYSSAQRYIQLFVATQDGTITVEDIAEAGQIGALRAAAANDDEGDDEPPEPLQWTPEQEDRRASAEDGACVVADMHAGADGALVQWAKATDRFVRIDRKTEWGNPFEMPEDGERAEVVGKYSKFYLPYKDGLLARIPTLRGKVLGCWCHPAECHGHIIAEIVNREASGEAGAWRIADAIAEIDG